MENDFGRNHLRYPPMGYHRLLHHYPLLYAERWLGMPIGLISAVRCSVNRHVDNHDIIHHSTPLLDRSQSDSKAESMGPNNLGWFANHQQVNGLVKCRLDRCGMCV